jgi:predicted DCC family thiol-disulfide oxidoreductase YuxK
MSSPTSSTSATSVILFDGVCNYCNSMVNFVIRQDRKKVFRFAPLQSAAGAAVLAQWGLPTGKLDSFVLVDEGKVYTRSTAALRVVQKLSPPWRWLGVFSLIPAAVRDGVYNVIARNRYRWFGQRDACMLPSPDVRNRFL